MAPAKELELTFGWRGLTLAGTLHLPETSGTAPTVLMAQGSGPADRDSGGYFDPIRQAFLRRGIATFSFDKPGCGASSGQWQRFGLQDRRDQALAALHMLKQHPAIDETAVGLWGHSQGGWIAQQVAASGHDVAFAVAGSAPSINVQSQILYDCEQSIRRCGHPEHAVAAALTLCTDLQRSARDGATFDEITKQLLPPSSSEPWYPDFPGIDDALDWLHFSILVNEPHDPIRDLEKVSVPFLAVYGGLDVLLPTWICVEHCGQALALAPTASSAVVTFPGGDHRVQIKGTKVFADGYLDALGDWVLHQIRRPSPS